MRVLIDLVALYLFLVVGLAYLGYGATRLLLPVSLWRWQPLLTPFLGYAVVTIVFHSLNTSWLNAEQSTVVLLTLTTGLNAFAVARRGRLRAHPTWKDDLIPMLLSFGVYIGATIPLISYGFITVVGTNGDVEQYLAGADYIRRFNLSALATAPPNPLLDLAAKLTGPFGGWGFTYILSLVTLILGWSGEKAFAPLLAFLVAANVIAMHLFARSVLGLSWRGSAFASFALGVNGLLLWTGFFNYGRQVAVLPLLPVAALAFLASFRHRSWRSILFAALLFAAVTITYRPATLLLLVSMSIFAAMTIVRGRHRLRLAATIGAPLALGFLPLGASLPEYMTRISRVFSERVLSGSPISKTPLFSEFLPLNHLYGLSYYVWPAPEPAGERLSSTLVWVVNNSETGAVALSLALGIYALWRTTRAGRDMALSLTMASALFLGAMRLIDDRYSYFKILTFSSFWATSLGVLGLSLVWQAASRSRSKALESLGKNGLSLFGVAFLSLGSINAYFTINHFLGKPQSPFVSPYLDVAQLSSIIEPQASICLTSAPSLQGGAMGVIAYSLMAYPLYPLYGGINTAESGTGPPVHQGSAGRYFSVSSGNRGRETNLCDYALLAASEEPSEWGYSADSLVWANKEIKVYSREGTMAHLQFDTGNGGRTITSAEPFRTIVTAATMPEVNPGDSQYLVIQMGTFSNQQLVVEIDGKENRVAIGPGLWRYQSESTYLPASVAIRSEGPDPIFLNWLELRYGSRPAPSKTKLERALLLQSASMQRPDSILMQVGWLSPEPQLVRGWIEIWVRNRASSGDRFLIGRGALDKADHEIQVQMLLPGGQARSPSTESGVSRWNPDWRDGEYVGELYIVFDDLVQDEALSAIWQARPDLREAASKSGWEPGQWKKFMLDWWQDTPEASGKDRDIVAFARKSMDFTPSYEQKVAELFTLRLRQNSVVEAAMNHYPFLHHYFPPSPWTSVDEMFGNTARLFGYTMEERLLHPGGEVRLDLYWQVPKGFNRDWQTFAHLLDNQGQVWGQHDESLMLAEHYQNGGGDTEILRAPHTFGVNKLAPTGRYAIEVGIYLPEMMQRQEGSKSLHGDRVIIQGVKVVGPDSTLSGAAFRPQYPKQANLGGEVRFLGYDVEPSSPKPGESLLITLYWQAERKMDKDYTVFVHLLDEENKIRGQSDSRPLQARYPTSTWTRGEIVVDRHSLSLSELASGRYRIAAGMYLLATGARLPAVGGDQENRIALGTCALEVTEGISNSPNSRRLFALSLLKRLSRWIRPTWAPAEAATGLAVATDAACTGSPLSAGRRSPGREPA